MSVLALIPARAGSKAFPGKNLAMLAGLSLVGHAIRVAQGSRCVDRVVVSTDADAIAEEARRLGAEVPFLRPAELATDEASTWDVVRHAVDFLRESETVVLLQPTSPFRLPDHIDAAVVRLAAEDRADGVVGVATTAKNPLWSAVSQTDGWMQWVWPDAVAATRRQQLPESLQITGALYVWRRSFVHRCSGPWSAGRHLVHRMPPWTTTDIDEPWDLALAQALLDSGAVNLPWCTRPG